MGYRTTTRSREYRQGWLGRKRNYLCRECGVKFQVDTSGSLPEIDRVCPKCGERTYVYTFVDKRNGKEKQVRASNVQLATVRAWKTNPKLTFKIPKLKGVTI